MRQALVRCAACDKAYTAHVVYQGHTFVQTGDGACWCGHDEFIEIGSPRRSEGADRSDGLS